VVPAPLLGPLGDVDVPDEPGEVVDGLFSLGLLGAELPAPDEPLPVPDEPLPVPYEPAPVLLGLPIDPLLRVP
jgi:hypothetical protein